MILPLLLHSLAACANGPTSAPPVSGPTLARDQAVTLEHARALRVRDPRGLLTWLAQLAAANPADARAVAPAWWDFVRGVSTPGELVALVHMDFSIVDALFALDRGTDSAEDLAAIDEAFARRPELIEVRRLFTDVVLRHAADFAREFIPHADAHAAMLLATDWPRVIDVMTPTQVVELVESTRLARAPAAFGALRSALLDRVAAALTPPLDDVRVDLASRALDLSAVATPAGEALARRLLAHFDEDAGPGVAARALRVLRAVDLTNFTDAAAFADVYAANVARLLAPGGALAHVPFPRVVAETHAVRERFAGPLAARILDRLAELYRAEPAQRAWFLPSDQPATDLAHAPPARAWAFVTAKLGSDHLVRLGEALASFRAFDHDLVTWLQLGFHDGGLIIDRTEVERETRRWFNRLSEVERADVLTELALAPERHSARVPTRLDRERLRTLEILNDANALAREHGVAGPAIERGKGAAILAAPPARAPRAIDASRAWAELTESLAPADALTLIAVARDGADPGEILRWELRRRLARAGVRVEAGDVSQFVHERFDALPSPERVAIVRTLLARGITDDVTLRRRAFRDVARRLPDPPTRALFLKLWTAALGHVPRAARPVVLAAALAERTPARAMAAMLSQMDVLGAALADVLVTDARFRAVVGADVAAPIGRWEAFDLLGARATELRTNGFDLADVRPTGPHAAEVDLVRPATGERLIVPVRRAVDRRAVRAGARRLRRFAAEVATLDPRAFGAIPLLVEDAIAPVTDEVRETAPGEPVDVLARAADRLGWSIDAAGVIDTGSLFVRSELEHFDHPRAPVDGVTLDELKAVDPDLHAHALARVFALERAVLRDLHAPVDTAPTPARYSFERATRTLWARPPRHARAIDMEVHAALGEFVAHAVNGDVPALNQMVLDLTGVPAPPADHGLRRAAPIARPLAFLESIAAPYLARPVGDVHRARFLDLVHGVRAHVRLAEGQRAEGLATIFDANDSRAVERRGVIVRAIGSVGRTIARAWRTTRAWLGTVGTAERVMDAAYRPDVPVRTGLAGGCERLLTAVKNGVSTLRARR